MRIYVVSDTHNNLKTCRPIVEIFNESSVACVIHTGYITQAKTLDVFADLTMPLMGVFGNNDQEREALESAIEQYGFEFREPPWVLTLAGRSICLVHDPLEFPSSEQHCFDLRLHGHTHRFCEDRVAGQLTFNPGECAGMMLGLNAVGIVDLSALTAEVRKF